MKKQIIKLLKNRESGKAEHIEISADEIDIYFNNEVPEESKIDYEHIAEYIINANK